MKYFEMAEPTSSSITVTALLIGLLGSAAGQYACIVMAALAGALWPLSWMDVETRKQGAMFLLRVVSAAVILTGSVAYWLETEYKFPAAYSLSGVAFLIGALGNGWRPVLEGIGKALGNFAGSLGGK